jgi:hypothetical protein
VRLPDYVFQYLQHASRAFAAGDAFAEALLVDESHVIPYKVNQAGGLVNYYEPS